MDNPALSVPGRLLFVHNPQRIRGPRTHSTVTDFARLRGLSTSVPFCRAA